MWFACLQSPLEERRSRRLARGKRTGGSRLHGHHPGGERCRLSGRNRALAAIWITGLLFVSAAPAVAAHAAGEKKRTAIRVVPGPQIFATLCALYAAGYPAIPASSSLQLTKIVQQVAALQGPDVTALRRFYQSHKLPSDADTVARYMSFAMVVGPPPSFQYLLPDEELPPDVRALAGFRKVLRTFYTENHIERFWEEVEPSYEAEAVRLRGPVSQVVSVEAGYVRRMNPFSGDRTFTVYVNPLVGSQTNFRIYSESYEMAVNPSAPGTMRDIRLAFLHFLLDPLAFGHPAIIKSKSAVFNIAVHAPRLPEEYKRDFVAFTDECLVRAVALRMGPASGRKAALARDDRDGYVLVLPLYYGLEAYERSPSTLADYFPTLIKSIDEKAEAARDKRIVFAPAKPAQPAPAPSGARRIGQWLDEGYRQIAAQDGKGAEATFARVLRVDPRNARAKYGLAVASALSGQGAQARKLFEQVASSSSADPSTQAWSHVFLGRMNDLAGHRQDALVQYRAALGIAGISPMVRAAAEQGIQKAFAVGKPGAGVNRHP